MSQAERPSADASRLPAGACPSTRVALPVGTLVITDLHLAPFGDERTSRFVRLCDQLEGVPALVCLGDLFDIMPCRQQSAQKRTDTRLVLHHKAYKSFVSFVVVHWDSFFGRLIIQTKEYSLK